MTPERRAELQALADAASPGPWETYEPHGQDTIWLDVVAGEHDEILSAETLYIGQVGSEEHQQSQANIAFVAAARTAVPELLAENTAQERRIAELEKALRSLTNEASGFIGMAIQGDYMKTHGVTNTRVMRLRIDEARAALEAQTNGGGE